MPNGTVFSRDAMNVNAQDLARRLQETIAGEVRFDHGTRALYATDASNYRQVPIGVVFPRCTEDVIASVALCREYGAPLVARGGGTSLAGQCCNVAVILEMSKFYHQVLEIEGPERRVRVQPGIVLDHLQRACEPHGLVFGPDPATHSRCTLGGMLGNNSCGVHSVMAQFRGGGARTSDNVEELDVLTYDGLRLRVGPTREAELDAIIRAGGRRGELYAGLRRLRDRYAHLIREHFPQIPRRVSGYNLDELLPEKGFHVARALVGSEGTCVTILEATLSVLPKPRARSLLVLGYPSVYEAAEHVLEILDHRPIGLEGIDDELIRYMHRRGLHPDEVALLPAGRGWLLVEFGGDTKADADEQARELMAALRRQPGAPSMKLFDDPQAEHKLWEVRESGLGATAFIPGMRDSWPGWEDSAVPPARVGEYLRALRELFDRYDYHAALYGHFGQGCVHCRIDFDVTTAPGLARYRAFLDDAADLVVRLGGALSGEHGDGQSRAELLPKMYGPELVRAFQEFKRLWDPQGAMNPGKVVDPNPILSELRLGSTYRPWLPSTHFQFPEDHGNFSRSALRCVGVGLCRRTEGGTMCPSYRVTRDEKDSTRGRAHALFEMLHGGVIERSWRNEHVKHTLDLCLACKGCKADCPVNVDMATYKAEFLAHYYQGRLRPRTAYSMGLVSVWLRLASKLPGLVNWVTQAPLLGASAKWLAGIASDRSVPLLARETFKHWFFRRPVRNAGAPQVLLWADTFNNYFHPQIAQAAVEVLEEAGFQVIVPKPALCCGRPLYDYGMLRRAKKLLHQVLDALSEPLAVGVPIIGLEPSCLAVFRDELRGLLPHDPQAQRLSEMAFTLSEFLLRKADQYQPPAWARQALVHGHCHHHAIMKLHSEQELYRRMGLAFQVLDSGCCGMAGSFGFEADKYDLSVKCGERVLLPAVRAASPETLIIADGFSCREQIRQLTDREALHTAEVLQRALREGRSQSAGRLRPFVKADEQVPPGVKEADERRRAAKESPPSPPPAASHEPATPPAHASPPAKPKARKTMSVPARRPRRPGIIAAAAGLAAGGMARWMTRRFRR